METRFENMSLTDDGSMVFEGEGDPMENNSGDLSLVGRFLTDRTIRFTIMRERMADVWRPGKGVTIKEQEKGVYVFQFYYRIDMQRVLMDGPWNFDNQLLILEKIKPGESPA